MSSVPPIIKLTGKKSIIRANSNELVCVAAVAVKISVRQDIGRAVTDVVAETAPAVILNP